MPVLVEISCSVQISAHPKTELRKNGRAGSVKLSSNVVVIMIRKYLNPLFDMF